jgi:hypothetical protein
MDDGESSLQTTLTGYLELACQATHVRNILRGRNGILQLPREWLLTHIEDAAEPLLQTNDPWEWQRLLEVYEMLDAALALRLSERAKEHIDPEIREAGVDFWSKVTS